MPDKLSTYHAKRNFGITPEPRGMAAAPSDRLRFVVQKHDARRLHYDFRLEIDGTLKSWAVPKGPSLDPAEKRLAVHVEDHPLDYIDFEGDIPEHQYGAGHVDVWDIGYWEPQDDPAAAYRAGKIKFRLEGEKLHGGWTLVRTRLAGGGKEQWLLIKEKDETARAASDYDITEALPDSVLQEAPSPAAKETRKPQTPRKTNDASLKTAAPRAAAGKPDKAKIKGAVKAPLPDNMVPQLATLVNAVPPAGDWLFEIKFDGYRLLARVDKGEVTLFTRDGKDWTARLPKQVEAIKALKLKSAWLDGEIVVLDEHGVPSFQLLQNAFDEKSPSEILYFLFDVPYLDGYDLREAALSDRRARLGALLADTDKSALRYSAPMSEPPQQLLDSACSMSMEGIIGKLADSPYVGKRSNTWIKLKCHRRQEFVIAGYTEPQGSRKFLGALLLGVYEDGKLRYTGRVGTGFDRKTLLALHQRLSRLEIDKRPFDSMPAGVRRAETHWVKPQLVAEISFAEWTSEGIVRQAVFHGLREDKPAKEIRREQSISVAAMPAASAKPEKQAKTAKSGRARAASAPQDSKDIIEGIRITHADRVVDPTTGLTKFDVAAYYARVAPLLLPYLDNRPVYLLRCPEGIRGEQFFQKHASKLSIPGIRLLDPALDPEHDPLMAIDDAHALAGANQMGAIELHTCSATADKIDRPDSMVFDLDPDPALPWKKVKAAAQLVKVMLDELGLTCFLKTSGGKGLHIVVPLARRHTWDEVTDFSQAVALHLARTLPKLFSATMGEKNRVNKIFVDFQRNRRHASTVAPYSVRARPGLPVSVPIAWEELDQIGKAAAWTIATLPERLDTLKQDPWRDFLSTRQSLTAAMKKALGLVKK